MKVSDHPLTVRALELLDLDRAELIAIEDRPADVEDRLDRFKANVKAAFKRGVLKHHPDRGGDPDSLITIKQFCDWVQGWSVRPIRSRARGQVPIEIMVRMHNDLMKDLFRGFAGFTSTTTTGADAADAFAQAVYQAQAQSRANAGRSRPPTDTGGLRGSYEAQAAPNGTRVYRRQEQDGTRVHRVRKERKP